MLDLKRHGAQPAITMPQPDSAVRLEHHHNGSSSNGEYSQAHTSSLQMPEEANTTDPAHDGPQWLLRLRQSAEPRREAVRTAAPSKEQTAGNTNHTILGAQYPHDPRAIGDNPRSTRSKPLPCNPQNR